MRVKVSDSIRLCGASQSVSTRYIVRMHAESSRNREHAVVVEHYASLAHTYDQRWDRYSRATLTAVLRHVDVNNVESILDVACGTGRFATMARQINEKVAITGTDLSPDMIEVATSRLPPGEGIAWHVAPAESLPLDDASFDVLTCANAFHLVADPQASMQEFYRVLRPGGMLVIVDWCREYLTMKLLLRASRMFGRQYRRIRTRDELNEVIRAGGFDVQQAERFKATWFWGMMCITARRSDGDDSAQRGSA